MLYRPLARWNASNTRRMRVTRLTHARTGWEFRRSSAGGRRPRSTSRPDRRRPTQVIGFERTRKSASANRGDRFRPKSSLQVVELKGRFAHDSVRVVMDVRGWIDARVPAAE